MSRFVLTLDCDGPWEFSSNVAVVLETLAQEIRKVEIPEDGDPEPAAFGWEGDICPILDMKGKEKVGWFGWFNQAEVDLTGKTYQGRHLPVTPEEDT